MTEIRLGAKVAMVVLFVLAGFLVFWTPVEAPAQEREAVYQN